MNESTKPEANETIFEAEEIDDVVDRLHNTALRLDALHALNCEQTAERKRLAEELAAERRLADELKKELDFKRREAESFEERYDAERKRVAELETELNAANEKNAGLVNLADALRQDRDLALRTSDERRRAIARRDGELIETRRQRDDFERIAREARRENWLWRVVGFVSGAAYFGASWIF